MPLARAFNREQAGRALQRRGVLLRCHTAVVEVGPHTLSIEAVAGGEGTAILVADTGNSRLLRYVLEEGTIKSVGEMRPPEMAARFGS